jgi:hypothetical protein
VTTARLRRPPQWVSTSVAASARKPAWRRGVAPLDPAGWGGQGNRWQPLGCKQNLANSIDRSNTLHKAHAPLEIEAVRIGPIDRAPAADSREELQPTPSLWAKSLISCDPERSHTTRPINGLVGQPASSASIERKRLSSAWANHGRCRAGRPLLCLALAVGAVLYCRHFWADAPKVTLHAEAARCMLEGNAPPACSLFIPGNTSLTPRRAPTNDQSERLLRRLLDTLYDIWWWAIEDWVDRKSKSRTTPAADRTKATA